MIGSLHVGGGRNARAQEYDLTENATVRLYSSQAITLCSTCAKAYETQCEARWKHNVQCLLLG